MYLLPPVSVGQGSHRDLPGFSAQSLTGCHQGIGRGIFQAHRWLTELSGRGGRPEALSSRDPRHSSVHCPQKKVHLPQAHPSVTACYSFSKASRNLLVRGVAYILCKSQVFICIDLQAKIYKTVRGMAVGVGTTETVLEFCCRSVSVSWA